MSESIPLPLTAKVPRQEKPTEKVWIVKYALTEGPYLADAEVDSEKGFATVREPGHFPQYFHGEGREWCRTKEEALKACDLMRLRKLESMERRMDKLVNLNFKKMLGVE